jgi:hypothetical protein
MMSHISSELLLRLVADAASKRTEAERHFREMVATARAGGVSLPRIAQAAGLSVSRIHGILGEESDHMSALSATFDRPRPTTPDDDVLVVAGGKFAVAVYLRQSAYICQPERSFRDVERVGFYRNGQIEPFFPRIRYRKMNIDFTRENAAALRATGATLDAEVADVIERTLDDPADPQTPRKHQVFLLTPLDDPQTLRLERPIMHRTLGRGTAWTQGTRYTSEEKLRRNPATTDDLGRNYVEKAATEEGDRATPLDLEDPADPLGEAAARGPVEGSVEEAVRALRADRHQSWSNIRKAIASLQGRPHEPFGTANVEASAKSTVRKMRRETGLDLDALSAVVERLAGP